MKAKYIYEKMCNSVFHSWPFLYHIIAGWKVMSAMTTLGPAHLMHQNGTWHCQTKVNTGMYIEIHRSQSWKRSQFRPIWVILILLFKTSQKACTKTSFCPTSAMLRRVRRHSSMPSAIQRWERALPTMWMFLSTSMASHKRLNVIVEQVWIWSLQFIYIIVPFNIFYFCLWVCCKPS